MSPIKKEKTLNGRLMSSTMVFFIEDDVLRRSKDLSIVKLRHPSSSQPALFIIGPKNDTFCEVLSFNESKRSWFIDENVKSDGRILISTPIDPLFLIIPYLKKSTMAKPLEQCLEDETYPEIQRLASCRNLRLSLVADQKGDKSLRAYKFNEEKTLNWLDEKTKKLVEIVKAKNINVSQATVSANYINSKYQSKSETDYLEYAHGIISEYLDEELSKKLAQHLKLPEASESKKRKSTNQAEGIREKKCKIETETDSIPSDVPVTPRSNKNENVAKPASLTKKEQARKKAAAGSKSITSFFKKV